MLLSFLTIFMKCFVLNMGYIYVSGAGKSSEEGQTELTQLRKDAEKLKEEVENLKSALEQKMTEAEERLMASQEKDQEVNKLSAALDGKRKELEEKVKELEEMKTELEEVNKLLEEKSKEADESMEKYCSLMLEVHKLEKTNEALKTRLELIGASQNANDSHSSSTEGRQRSGRKSSTRHQEIKIDDNTENIAPSTTQRSPPGSGKRGHCEISTRDSAQEALHNVTKRIKANATTTPKSRPEQEDEEFRPEGLPELVQRG